MNQDVMVDLNSITDVINHHLEDFHQHGVKSLAVFGSVARGEASPSRDIDFLVEFDRPVGLFEFIRVKLLLEELTGKAIDLVTTDAIHPAMRDQILREAINVT
jgi:uncharacterized protein